MASLLPLLVFLSFVGFATCRILSYLHFFQQEEYDAKRFFSWILQHHAVDKRLSLTLAALWILSFFVGAPASDISVALAFGVFAVIEKNPLRGAKKPLVLTGRAKRILALSFLLMAGTAGVAVGSGILTLLWIVPVQMIPFALAAANLLWTPYEKYINAGFRKEAVEKLHTIDPYVIGVTGSFGKTSVKHMLGHILQNFAPTLITPGSVNADMGIVRTIREQMKPQHKFFIVEMGAYGIGSIARICRLTPPKMSIITAVGAAHFERFKSLEDTAKAKFEIAEAALSRQGKIVIHDSTLQSDYATEFHNQNKKSFIVCGNTGDLIIRQNVQTKRGLELVLAWKGKEYALAAPVFGLHHAANLALAFAAAAELGMPPEDIAVSCQTLPQIKHRLEVKRFDGYTLIDDAYNSNPLGFRAALEVLDLLGKDSRRILVTPGMVELGDKHDTEHAALGKLAAEKADIVIAVQPDRIGSFCKAFEGAMKSPQQIIMVASFDEAQLWLNQNRQPDDVILLENDLPDLYERTLRI